MTITEYEDTKDGILINNNCNGCEAVFTTNNSLLDHYISKHEGVKYYCSECEYMTGDRSTLTRHKQSKHEEVNYSCD